VLTLLFLFYTQSASHVAANTEAEDEFLIYPRSSYRTLFDKHVVDYKLSFTSQVERQRRFDIFSSNVDYINEFNSLPAPARTSTVGINKFTHWTRTEYLEYASPKMMDLPDQQNGLSFASNTLEESNDATEKTSVPSSAVSLPASWDWVAKGAVTPVKDQGNCGLCYAFAAVGALEGAYFLKFGKLPGPTPAAKNGFTGLSEEQWMECMTGPRRSGANRCKLGGYSEMVWLWAVNNGGMATEADYPYLNSRSHLGHSNGSAWYANNGTCRAQVPNLPGTQPDPANPYTYVFGNVQDVMAALTQRPLTISINVACPSFGAYKSGVLSDPSCLKYGNGSNYHRVLLVGYGTDNVTGLNYWKVKNRYLLHIVLRTNMCTATIASSSLSNINSTFCCWSPLPFTRQLLMMRLHSPYSIFLFSLLLCCKLVGILGGELRVTYALLEIPTSYSFLAITHLAPCLILICLHRQARQQQLHQQPHFGRLYFHWLDPLQPTPTPRFKHAQVVS